MKRLAAGALLLLLAGCEKGGAGAGAGSPDGEDHPLVGVSAPEFELPAQHGASRVSLPAGGDGKVKLVDFWATWCEPCKESFPVYQALAERFDGRLEVIGISEDDDSSGIKRFAKETGVRFPLAWDEGQALSKEYQPPTMPTSYVIDKNGIVRMVHAGFKSGDEAQITAAIEQADQ
ncbi:MAG TPA: TlpA disulfide reductase family protein [Polyangiaceae bacterium]|nr:TlpA disulfide reductase family protein [Polyangiaceae bacterium]